MCCTQRETMVKGQIVIIYEFKLSEILTKKDFYRNAQIIIPSNKATAICEVVNYLIGVLSPSWLLANWYTKTFLD